MSGASRRGWLKAILGWAAGLTGGAALPAPAYGSAAPVPISAAAGAANAPVRAVTYVYDSARGSLCCQDGKAVLLRDWVGTALVTTVTYDRPPEAGGERV